MDVLTILAQRLEEMAVGFVRILPQLAIAVLLVLVTRLVAGLTRRAAQRLLQRTPVRSRLKGLVQTLVEVGVWVVGLLVTLSVVLPSVTPANVLAVLGLGSVAVGFAFKDIFENFLAGVLIMLRRKMRIGDMIECEGVEGRVEHISLRETYLRALSNEVTIVPNSHLFKHPVRVLTDADERRYEVSVGVAYDTDLERARDVIARAVAGAELVSKAKPPEVYAREFGASSIDFTVRWWSGSKPIDMHRSRDAVVRAVFRALGEAGIEIPFPHVTNIFKGALPVSPEPERAGRA